MGTDNQPPNDVNSHMKIRIGLAGLHFFNRKTGINLLIDEFMPPYSLWSTAPRQVSIALTNACDLTCPHCYAPTPKNLAMLSFERVIGWLIELDANGCIGVGFGGGEPTLYRRLAELCFFTANKTNLAVTMTTHAHNISSQLLDDLAGNLHFVRVSMDGVEDTYESIRCRSFDALIKQIVALRKIVPFGINFLVNSKTIGDIETAVHLATELGAAEFLLLPEEPIRRGGGINLDTTINLQNWVNGYRGSVPLSVRSCLEKNVYPSMRLEYEAR